MDTDSGRRLADRTCLILLTLWVPVTCGSATRGWRIVHLISHLLSLLAFAHFCFICFQAYVTYGISQRTLAAVVFTMTAFACRLILWIRRDKLRTLLIKTIAGLDSESVGALTGSINACLAVWLLVFLLHLSSVAYTVVTQNGGLALQLTRIVQLPIIFWIMTTVVFYAGVLLILSRLLVLQMQRITATLASLCFLKADVLLTVSRLHSMQSSISEFDDAMSSLPFLWFLLGITCSSGYLSQLISSGGQLITFVYFSQDYLPPVVLVLLISRLKRRLEREARQASQSLASHPCISSGEKMLLLREMDLVVGSEVTGASFFPLNKTFLVSYLGSVLTFAVLIAGLMKKSL